MTSDSFLYIILCSYRVYKARKQLAAIDWNFHLMLEAATSKAGDLIVTRKYDQRTKEWNSKVVKVKKGYGYIPMLMGKILHARKEDVDIVTRQVSLNESDPALLAPKIAEKPAPPSKDLFSTRKSRFEPSHSEGNTHTSAMSEDMYFDIEQTNCNIEVLEEFMIIVFLLFNTKHKKAVCCCKHCWCFVFSRLCDG